MQKLSHSEEWSKSVSESWKNKSEEEMETLKQKHEETMMKKYGVRHNWCKGSALREKEEAFWKEKYGGHPLCSKIVRDKIKKTKFEKYGNEYYTNREKAVETMIEEHGCYYNNHEQIHKTWSQKSEEELKEIARKKRETSLEKYGTECPLQNEEVKEKTKKTSLEKYGVECPVSSEFVKEKRKQTCLALFGETTVLKNEEVKEKIKQTCLEKYGVEYASQSPEFQSKIRKFYNFNNLTFDSKYELYFYIFNKEMLGKEVVRDKIFEYIFEGEKCYYYCDFCVDGQNVEIKGPHLFKDGTLYFPYRNLKNWEFHQRKWETKFECMKDNDVKLILTNSEEMKEIMNEVNKKYTKDFVSLFNTRMNFPYPNENFYDKSDMGLIHYFHKSIYEAHRKNKISPVKAWEDKNLVKEIALNRIEYVGRCLPSDIIQGFNVTLKAPKVSVFSPYVAKELVEKYLSECNSIVDPFSGFSGRMLGASGCGKEYHGFDLNEKHVEESNEIIKYRNLTNCTVEMRDILENVSVESYDSLFTCPPYNDKENWNGDFDILKSCDEWIDICLNKFHCKKYLFVVDETVKYANNVVDNLTKKSHFGDRTELVILIEK